MVYSTILFSVTLIGLIIATITDLKTREVPDWLSYGLIAIGLGLNLLFSFIYNDYWFFVNSLVGFLLFLMVALIMFYAGQWGGGDSKVLMSLGALIGFDVRFIKFPFMIVDKTYGFTQLEKIFSNFLVGFFINILLMGAIYGLIWSFSMAFMNWKNFYREFKKVLNNVRIIKLRRYVIVLFFLMIVLSFFLRKTFFSSILFALSAMIVLIFYLWVFVKAIEKTCMIKQVTPDKLTEGDWIAKNVMVDGKYICGPKDLGIEKKQIRKLVGLYKQKKINKIWIKEGIPFVPSFLVAYILSLVFGNWLFLLI